MEDAAAKSSKLRALADNFLVVVQEIVVEKGDPAKLAQIDALIDEMRSSGFIKASLDRAKISGRRRGAAAPALKADRPPLGRAALRCFDHDQTVTRITRVDWRRPTRF